MPELAVRYATAVREDGLSDAKEPDHFVKERPNVWRLWDTRTLASEVATGKSAIEAVCEKMDNGQAKRIAINLDGAASTDGATFAREMRTAVSADRKSRRRSKRFGVSRGSS